MSRSFVAVGLLIALVPVVALLIAAAARSSGGPSTPLAVSAAVPGGPTLALIILVSLGASALFLAAGWYLGREIVHRTEWRSRTVCPGCAEAIPAADPTCVLCGHDLSGSGATS